jgi:hypothetical protein
MPGKKFCAECGSPLSNRCSNCNSDNAPGAKFCADCGSALRTDVVAEGAKPSAARADGGVRIASEWQTSETIEGERKTVTALFANIGCEGNCRCYAPAQKELMLVLRPNLFFGKQSRSPRNKELNHWNCARR